MDRYRSSGRVKQGGGTAAIADREKWKQVYCANLSSLELEHREEEISLAKCAHQIGC